MIDIPLRMANLPLDTAGRPIPMFTQWFDGDTPTDFGVGKPDFRIADSRHLLHCIKYKGCWVCGQQLGRFKTFVVGPMCVVNMISSEPPSHWECGRYSARMCPFLNNPDKQRRETAKPDVPTKHAGIMVERNPGVSAVITTRQHRPIKVPNGILFRIGEPESIEWFCRGRQATADEVIASIESGKPALYEADRGKPSERIAHLLLDKTIEKVIERVKIDLADA